MKERITRPEISAYKREKLDQTVLVRLDEAAAILAVSTRTLQRRVDEGRITAYNDNKTKKGIRFLASELSEYVKKMKIDTSSELESLQNF
ncbi:MAG: helix-turn-helix domain-containing protein [Desulfuromonadaceae bacterium]|nr:helix-turn-helix domain-containing protein [Desulfuromonadaceae bacterium]